MITCIAAMVCTGEIFAQTAKNVDMAKPTINIPRLHLEPVPSLELKKSGAIDTLDTVNEYVKVILYADNTWKYYKLPSFEQNPEVFDEHWDEEVSNPYKLEHSSLPYSWSIWLV